MAKASKSEAASGEPLLRVGGLEASIDGYHILYGIDLAVERNSTIAMLGRNGAGKTTTLKSIMGFVPDTNGEISFNGESLLGVQTYEICHRGIAYVPEDRGLFPFLTVEENLKVPRSAPEAWDNVFELFPILKERIKQQAGLLSGGQQQMLSIGRALIQGPELLLLDEPCQGLAPLLIDDLVERLLSLKSQMSIVLVEQNIAVARRLGDRFVVLDDGRSVLSGTIADLDTNIQQVEEYLAVPTL